MRLLDEIIGYFSELEDVNSSASVYALAKFVTYDCESELGRDLIDCSLNDVLSNPKVIELINTYARGFDSVKIYSKFSSYISEWQCLQALFFTCDDINKKKREICRKYNIIENFDLSLSVSRFLFFVKDTGISYLDLFYLIDIPTNLKIPTLKEQWEIILTLSDKVDKLIDTLKKE